MEIANKVGCAEVISRVVEDLKDESEPYRKMASAAEFLIVFFPCDHAVCVVGNGDGGECSAEPGSR